MVQQRSRFHRIVRHAVMALAIVVLLPVWYVGSAISLAFLNAAGMIPRPAAVVISPVYEPLSRYVYDQYPGGDTIKSMVNWAIEAGNRFGN